MTVAPTPFPGPPRLSRRRGTHCTTWPLGAQRAAVSCWTEDGHPIRCCGHGLLSCALVWSRSQERGGVFCSGEQELPWRVRADEFWVGFPDIRVSRTIPCQGIADLLESPAEPRSWAACAGDEGYLIVEYPEDTSLEGLRPPGRALGSHSRQALIVTCHVSEERDAEAVDFRYFAPQYGVAEDSATGSGMRVLAAYWRERGLGDRLVAAQRSPAGGRLLSCCENELIWVGGRVVAA